MTVFKPEKGDLLSSVETEVVVLLCSRLSGGLDDGTFPCKSVHCPADSHWPQSLQVDQQPHSQRHHSKQAPTI